MPGDGLHACGAGDDEPEEEQSHTESGRLYWGSVRRPAEQSGLPGRRDRKDDRNGLLQRTVHHREDHGIHGPLLRPETLGGEIVSSSVGRYTV